MEDSCIPHHLCVTGKEDFALQGEGEQTRLIFTDPDLQGLRINQCKNVSLKDVSLCLENQPAVRHNRALLEVTASRDVMIQGIVSQQASGCGVFIDCCTGVKMTDCKIKDAGQHGIRISTVVMDALKIMWLKTPGSWYLHQSFWRDRPGTQAYLHSVQSSKNMSGRLRYHGIQWNRHYSGEQCD